MKQQFKATTLLGSRPVYSQLSPGLFHQSTTNPTNWLYSSWSICSLCEWIYVCPGFQVRSLCVILGLSLSYTHYIWLSINSTSRSARVSCSAPSLKCYSISPAWLTHLPISTIAHVTHSPQPARVFFPEHQIHYTSSYLHGAPPFTHSSQTTAASSALPSPPTTMDNHCSSGLCYSWHISWNVLHIILSGEIHTVLYRLKWVILPFGATPSPLSRQYFKQGLNTEDFFILHWILSLLLWHFHTCYL